MPKIQNELSQYLHEFVQLTSNEAVQDIRKNENFQKHLLAVTALHEKVSAMYRPDESGAYPKAKKEDLEALREKYLEVYRSGQQMQQVFAGQNQQDMPLISTLMDMTSLLMERMVGTFHLLDNSLDANNKSLPELLSHDHYRVDLGDKQLHTDVNMTDNRTAVSFTDSTGKDISGYFVKNEKSADLDAALMDITGKIAGNAIKDHPRFQAGIIALMNNEDFTNRISHPDYTENIFAELAEENDISKWFNNSVRKHLDAFLPEGESVDDYLDEITQDDTFTLCVMEVIKNYAPIRAKYDIVENGKIGTLSNTEQRCAAMNTMAGALGVSGIIAKTVKMQAIENGKVVEGLFTQKGEGSDIHNLKENDPATRVEKSGMNNPAALKSIAQLQMLDFICGNMNRQREKMLYQFAEKDGQTILTGVQGFENNYSFGAFDSQHLPRFSPIPKSQNLMAITEEMAEKIMAMTETSMQDLLKGHGLTEEEIGYAWERTQHIQNMIREGKEYFAKHPNEKIAEGHLRVVKDEEWQYLNLNELGNDVPFERKVMGRSKNYFSMVSDLPHLVAQQAEDSFDDRHRQNTYETKFPQLKKPAAPKPIEGVRLDEMNAAGMRSNSERITELGKQLLEANSGFFIGSAEFKALMGGFQAVAGKALKATEPMSVKDMTALQQSYQNLMEKTNIYLAKKEREEIALMEKGKEPSANMEKRMKFARVLREFVDERLNKLDHPMEVVAQHKLAIARKLMNGMKEKALREAQSPEEKINVERVYSDKNRKTLEQDILNHAVFQSVIDAKSPAQLKELAGSTLENIESVLNQNGAQMMVAPGQLARQNPDHVAGPQIGLA
jgi:hypothetical protein